MNYKLVYLVFFLINMNAHAKPKEALLPQDVCNSIDSNKYKAQCEQAIYKAKYFQPSALNVCHNIKFDNEKKSCMAVIRNQTFTKIVLEKCLEDEKLKKGVPLNKCLQKNSQEYAPKTKSKNDNDSAE